MKYIRRTICTPFFKCPLKPTFRVNRQLIFLILYRLGSVKQTEMYMFPGRVVAGLAAVAAVSADCWVCKTVQTVNKSLPVLWFTSPVAYAHAQDSSGPTRFTRPYRRRSSYISPAFFRPLRSAYSTTTIPVA